MIECPKCHKSLEDDLPFCVYCGAELLPEFPKVKTRYEIEALIGEGGMGEVYKAKDNQSQTPVAIKIIRAELIEDAAILERFHLETKALASVSHPHLVAVLDVDTTEDGRPYFVMPYLQGPTLTEKVGKQKILPEEAVRYVCAVLQAVAALHAQHWVHRDIKADNVILTQNETVPVLLDMGVARSLNQEAQPLTMVGEVVGTPEAMAPEQILGGTIDARTDVYQAGALLLFLLMGKPVFSAESTKSWYGMQLQGTPLTGSANLPVQIIQVCLKAMEKRPEDRYASANDMLAALGQPNTPAKPDKKPGFFQRLFGK